MQTLFNLLYFEKSREKFGAIYQYGEAARGCYSKGKGHPCTGTEALYRPYGP